MEFLTRPPAGGAVVLAAWAAVAVAAAGLLVPARRAQAQDTILIATADGGVVAGLEWGSGPRAVLLVPGGRYEKSSWDTQAEALAREGFRVLAIELRGRGASRAGSAGDDGMPLDVAAAVARLRACGAAEVSIVGASLGGWAAAEAVATTRATTGSALAERLVLLAAPAIDRPELLVGRTLFIVAGEDRSGTGPRLPALREQHRRVPGPKELVVLEGDAHAQALFATDQGPALLAHIVRFLTAP
jgi:pimeloyl-ACP methyl ester carboxylesterase